MLRELHVKNLAVLAAASVELGEGLNVLTGETGAGKSLVVDSLMLLAGTRASSELIRTGAEALTVTGVFTPVGDGWRPLLAEAGIELADDEILIRREISREGKNRVYVNDQPVTLRLLTQLAPYLLRIHGQREELGLVDPELQRVWLDGSGGAEAERLTAAVAEAFARVRRLAERLERAGGDERARRERLDFLRFQAGEIDAAALTAGEEDELRSERDVLRNLEAITHALGGSYALLFDDEGAAVERLAKGRGLLEEVAGWEPAAPEWASELAELEIRLGEVASAIARRLDGLEMEPGRLDRVEERLAVIERLLRKYGATTSEVLERRRAIAGEIEELEGDAAGRDELAAELEAALDAYRRAALELSAARRRWGEALVAGISRELAELGLAKARLEVTLERRRRQGSGLALSEEGDQEVDFGPHGVDHVTFLFAPNPGEEPQPLSRIASGGELSRIYLALQLAARRGAAEVAPTLVFDEVDSGVSGAQAAALGRKLQRLAAGGQILAVTHLPQVASSADLHLRVTKEVHGGRTHTRVEPLAEAARVEEVARLLAGREVTELSLSHARELIAGAARTSD